MNGSVSNLLEKVNLVQQKYDDFAEYTGENFNVFDVLGIYHHEQKHSVFIGNLLNAKSKHGQKDIFLKLFIEEIIDLFEGNGYLEDFITTQSNVVIEKYDGRVNLHREEGGRIDIFITDGNKEILIENKIWAGDQGKQLIRYANRNPSRFLVYLTLNGNEPAKASCEGLIRGEHFICVSYKEHIVNWLETCIKEMANKPIIRETLNQYLYLVKQLTNQTSNNKMAQEILNLIFVNEHNFNSAKEIVKALNERDREVDNMLDGLVNDFYADKDEIERAIKATFPNGSFTIVKRWSEKGTQMIRLDIVLEPRENGFENFVRIQLMNRDYKIYNEPWFSDNEIEERLSKLGGTTNYNYEYKNTQDQIFSHVKNQIMLISKALGEQVDHG